MKTREAVVVFAPAQAATHVTFLARLAGSPTASRLPISVPAISATPAPIAQKDMENDRMIHLALTVWAAMFLGLLALAAVIFALGLGLTIVDVIRKVMA